MTHPVSPQKHLLTVTLLGTEGCHLCDDAEALVHQVLQARGVPYRLDHRDIADSNEGIEQYGLRIPVLVNQGRELDWPFSAEQLAVFISDQVVPGP
ncbi:glutaredoxin family protein [Simiduia sp. 21SJ11W-1]|uniref:glutaredoxin family protein n=1 Tax=Simiduia sp. 21SJ11W-1 TaxID=2909669 RepID=UPI0020A21B5E|nr:glutaredoxin family protein [Simiduia sp. 21SJ11W-1]UTA49374.1 glutaredoxin family protein [Simiduia sp. 21SJ11W-1]